MSGAESLKSTVFNPARGFGVYIHWPYCTRICPYCDFNVYAAKTRDTAPLVASLMADLSGWRARSGPRRVDTVFLGGGTPSLLTGKDVETLLQHVDELWGVAANSEITIEANPDDVARFPDFSAAGVNRLSLGVQSLRDDQLKFLGRTHTAASARNALQAAQGHFRSVSLDMIYALPGQGVAHWRRELSDALALEADHLSLYELSIEPGAAFSRAVRRGDWTPADDDHAADLYELTQDLCDAAGLPAYEVSNHARSAEHRSQHNMIYWRSGDWVGAGPGAHGRLTANEKRVAVEAARRPDEYSRRVAETGVGWSDIEELDERAQVRERVAMALRHDEGLRTKDLTDLGFHLDRARVDELVAHGFVAAAMDGIYLTRKGRLAADRIAAELSP